MNTSTRILLLVLTVLVFATPKDQAHAQPLECGADDAECLDNAWARACGRASPNTDEESCLAWVQRLEAHLLADHPEWRLIAALGYTSLASYADLREEEVLYRQQSRSILREVLATWPEGHYAAQAYVGLANLTDDADENISLLRDAMRADPSNTNLPYLLASRLAARGQDDDYSEAADLYRESFWAWSGYYSAANALRLYALSGEIDQAADFKAEIARESGMVDFAEEVRSPQFAQNLERARSVLKTACERNIITIFGPETCATGIDTLVTATRRTNHLPARRPMADVAAEGMRMLSVSGSGTGEERRQRNSRFGSVLREWIDTGAATASVYVLWAQHSESEFDEAVVAFERAVELAPENGRYRYWLAQGYIKQGRYDEAIGHLTLARGTLPENSGITPESVDREIRRAESERNLRQ